MTNATPPANANGFADTNVVPDAELLTVVRDSGDEDLVLGFECAMPFLLSLPGGDGSRLGPARHT